MFIGQGLKPQDIKTRLDACLVTPEEQQAGYAGMDDPLFSDE